jgi:hypothetical protein
MGEKITVVNTAFCMEGRRVSPAALSPEPWAAPLGKGDRGLLAVLLLCEKYSMAFVKMQQSPGRKLADLLT